MAKRYELSDEAWTMVADLFTEGQRKGRPRLSDRLMLDGALRQYCDRYRMQQVIPLRKMKRKPKPGLPRLLDRPKCG